MSRTLVIFKPDCVRRGLVGEILTRFERKGIQIVGSKTLVAPVSLLAEHYAEHRDHPVFARLLSMMSRGSVIAMVLQGQDDNVANMVRMMLGPYDGPGPGTIRGDYQQELVSMYNLLHASASRSEAKREIALWFRPDELVGVLDGEDDDEVRG